MLRRLAAIAACVLFLAAVPTGSVYVTTLPSGADIWLDGIYVGRSPLVLGALAAGHHSVGLTMAGWTPMELDVSVSGGQTTLSSTRLDRAGAGVRPLPGSIGFHGMAPSSIVLDGLEVHAAKDGTIPASTGTHELVVRTPRGKITRTVTVWPQTRTDVVLRDDAEPPRPSVVGPADVFVPESAIHVEGDRVTLRYGGHEVLCRIGALTYRVDGRNVDYDTAPTMIGTRLYLPMEVLTLLNGNHDH
jgi:PEGA domain